MNNFEIKIPEDRLRVAQIIGSALPMGAVFFLGIVAGVLQPPRAPYNFEFDLLPMIFVIQAAVLLPAALFVPQTVERASASKAFANVNLRAEVEKESKSDITPTQINRYMDIYLAKFIIGSALLEGLALFGIVVYLIEQSMICLIGAAVIILIMFAKIPTSSRVQNSLAEVMDQQQFSAGRM